MPTRLPSRMDSSASIHASSVFGIIFFGESGGGATREDPDVGERNPASLSAWHDFGSRGRRAALIWPLFPHNPVFPQILLHLALPKPLSFNVLQCRQT
jgi:hypothetical protein